MYFKQLSEREKVYVKIMNKIRLIVVIMENITTRQRHKGRPPQGSRDPQVEKLFL